MGCALRLKLVHHFLYCIEPVQDKVIAEEAPAGAFTSLDPDINYHERLAPVIFPDDPIGESGVPVEAQIHCWERGSLERGRWTSEPALYITGSRVRT